MSVPNDHVRFRSLGRGSGAGLLITLLIHGAVVVVVYVSQVVAPPRAEATRDLVVTQLVQIGTPREKFWLPRITQPPRPKAPEAVIKVADDPSKPAPPKEAPRPEDADVSKNLKRALERARALSQAAVPEESTEGDPNGSPLGTATTAQEGDAYATAVHEAIRRNWTAPTGLINESELARLSADIAVTIDDDGTLGEPRVRKGSGNQFFDDSCVQAIKATRRVPPPPPALKAKFRRGLLVGFEGKDLAR